MMKPITQDPTEANSKKWIGRVEDARRVKKRLNTVGIDSADCARIRDLGFTASNDIKMYGERFKLVSDPFDEDDCVAVRATSGNNPEIRILRLPIAILLGFGRSI